MGLMRQTENLSLYRDLYLTRKNPLRAEAHLPLGRGRILSKKVVEKKIFVSFEIF
jgi:hypothetical protein